jgi:hypothetical protein
MPSKGSQQSADTSHPDNVPSEIAQGSEHRIAVYQRRLMQFREAFRNHSCVFAKTKLLVPGRRRRVALRHSTTHRPANPRFILPLHFFGPRKDRRLLGYSVDRPNKAREFIKRQA